MSEITPESWLAHGLGQSDTPFVKRPTPYPDKLDLANAMRDVMRRRDARIRTEAYGEAIEIVRKYASPPHKVTCGLQIAQIIDELSALADAEQEATR